MLFDESVMYWNGRLYSTIPVNNIPPVWGWDELLVELSQGQHDRLFEHSPEEGEEPNEEALKDEAWGYRDNIRRSFLGRKGYIEVSHPTPDGGGWSVMVSLSPRGQQALDALRQGLVWSVDRDEPNQRETETFWLTAVSSVPHEDHRTLTFLKETTHPWLEEARSLIVPRICSIWMERIAGIRYYKSDLFEEVMLLPDEQFREVKAAAMLRKIQLWTPR